MSDIIHYSDAFQQFEENEEKRTQRSRDKLAEFLASSHEMFTPRDLQHYAEETGKSISWLVENSNDLDPVLKSALLEGFSIDDLWHLNC